MNRHRSAAEQGNAEAQYSFGSIYAMGQIVPQNYAEAAKWYRLAADQGLAEAQQQLGTMYLNGRGVPQDDLAAARLIQKAALQGISMRKRSLAISTKTAKACRRTMQRRQNGFARRQNRGMQRLSGS